MSLLRFSRTTSHPARTQGQTHNSSYLYTHQVVPVKAFAYSRLAEWQAERLEPILVCQQAVIRSLNSLNNSRATAGICSSFRG